MNLSLVCLPVPLSLCPSPIQVLSLDLQFILMSLWAFIITVVRSELDYQSSFLYLSLESLMKTEAIFHCRISHSIEWMINEWINLIFLCIIPLILLCCFMVWKSIFLVSPPPNELFWLYHEFSNFLANPNWLKIFIGISHSYVCASDN